MLKLNIGGTCIQSILPFVVQTNTWRAGHYMVCRKRPIFKFPPLGSVDAEPVVLNVVKRVRSEALRPATALPVTLVGRHSHGYYGLSAPV